MNLVQKEKEDERERAENITRRNLKKGDMEENGQK